MAEMKCFTSQQQQLPDVPLDDVSLSPCVIGLGPACTNYFKMTGVSFLFQAQCEELVKKLTTEELNNFNDGRNDTERIRLMYNHAIKLQIEEYPSGKSLKDATDFKNFGNQLFQHKKLKQAIKEYNHGIVNCPFVTEEHRKLLAILIANRSAVLFEMGLYQNCIDDIDWVLMCQSYPPELHYKVLLRQGKSYSHLKQYKEAMNSINEAVKAGMAAHLSEQKLDELRHSLKVTEDELKKNGEGEYKLPTKTFAQFKRNPMYPAVSTAVGFECDPMMGRYAVATSDIPAGDVILEEEPFCIAVSKENTLNNCAHCAVSTINPIPCRNCSSVIFCSEECKRDGTVYHDIECKILPTIYDSEASVNCLMSLRIITLQGFDFFWSLKDEHDIQIADEVYLGKDYRRLYHLCNHSEMRPKGEFLHYTFMAIFLLRLLKRTNYFPFETADDVLREEEVFIGSLLLRHLQMLQFNAHELSEMRNCETGDIPYRNAHVGGGVYPTLALFNHSCEPSIIRYNKDNKIIARTVKYIKAGEPIYENYGPIYCSQELSVRRRKMKERYYFDCECIPCSEKWPLYQSLESERLRLKCRHCMHILLVDITPETPFFKCTNCKKANNLMKSVIYLIKLAAINSVAEDTFTGGDYEAAILFYRITMEWYHKFMVPPFQDMVEVQQRLRTCMLHDGNTEMLYKMPSTFLPITSVSGYFPPY